MVAKIGHILCRLGFHKYYVYKDEHMEDGNKKAYIGCRRYQCSQQWTRVDHPYMQGDDDEGESA